MTYAEYYNELYGLTQLNDLDAHIQRYVMQIDDFEKKIEWCRHTIHFYNTQNRNNRISPLSIEFLKRLILTYEARNLFRQCEAALQNAALENDM